MFVSVSSAASLSEVVVLLSAEVSLSLEVGSVLVVSEPSVVLSSFVLPEELSDVCLVYSLLMYPLYSPYCIFLFHKSKYVYLKTRKKIVNIYNFH